MNLSQRSNHTDWTLSLSNLFWSEEPATTKNGSDVKIYAEWRTFVLLYLILFICYVCLGLFWYICWARSSFDCLHHMKYSTFLGLQVSNPDNASQFQERSFLSEEATVQLCHKWTDPDSVSKYQNASSSRAIRGRKFQGGRTYKPKKDFAYRMHAGRPGSAIPKPNFGVLKRSVLWCFGGG